MITDENRLAPLIEFYKEQCTHGRHTETQRQAAGALLLAAAGGLIAIMGTLRFSIHCFPLAFLVVGLGIFGWLFMRVFEDKWTGTEERRNHYRKDVERIAEILPPEVAGSSHSLRRFWRGTFHAVTVTGIVCLFIVSSVAWVRYIREPSRSFPEAILKQIATAGNEQSVASNPASDTPSSKR